MPYLIKTFCVEETAVYSVLETKPFEKIWLISSCLEKLHENDQ